MTDLETDDRTVHKKERAAKVPKDELYARREEGTEDLGVYRMKSIRRGQAQNQGIKNPELVFYAKSQLRTPLSF
ncbi:hypothetical protein NECAME_11674 [Necator americanus]|uniref:Uncharacterized protein n=1 Tax=Necator americanus TaxID=51031 RepID=W2T351_NECAM|nr:hypothetical protein NECAME_11674 [Necator americanus]ETN76435.1 hypothetical protein NECAME_11674 [Necator americanus]